MAFTAVTFGIALIGSVEYYTQARYAGEVVYERLPSTILFSVIKLYAFSPTVSTGVPTPLCYEAAKWLAPLCTAYWLLRALEQVRTQLRQMDEEEPEDMESEAYQIWGEAHEELEDQADELLERLDAWEE